MAVLLFLSVYNKAFEDKTLEVVYARAIKEPFHSDDTDVCGVYRYGLT